MIDTSRAPSGTILIRLFRSPLHGSTMEWISVQAGLLLALTALVPAGGCDAPGPHRSFSIATPYYATCVSQGAGCLQTAVPAPSGRAAPPSPRSPVCFESQVSRRQ